MIEDALSVKHVKVGFVLLYLSDPPDGFFAALSQEYVTPNQDILKYCDWEYYPMVLIQTADSILIQIILNVVLLLWACGKRDVGIPYCELPCLLAGRVTWINLVATFLNPRISARNPPFVMCRVLSSCLPSRCRSKRSVGSSPELYEGQFQSPFEELDMLSISFDHGSKAAAILYWASSPNTWSRLQSSRDLVLL